MSVKYYTIGGIDGCTPPGFHQYVSRSDYQDLREQTIAAMELLQAARDWLDTLTTTSEAPEKGCQCRACESTRLQRRINEVLSKYLDSLK